MAINKANVTTELEELALSETEKKAISFFEKCLDDNWEIYVKPFLNGCRPDLVLLNPKVGIGVFDIKDWDLVQDNYQYIDDRFCVVEDKGFFSKRNPLTDLRHYRYEICNLYCPRLDSKYGLQVVMSGLIFPNANEEKISEIFTGRYGSREILFGKETIENKDTSAFAQDTDNRQESWMSEDTAADLRSWLIEPDYSVEQREPIEFNAAQRTLISTRTETGFRRIRGPAGAGKSVVIASRAAALANTGLRVLVVSFNITLLQYLRDLSARYPFSNPNKITWLNFHEWLKRTVLDLELDKEYNEIWSDAFVSGEKDEKKTRDILEKRLPNFLIENLSDKNLDAVISYDAILTDEGQDFHPLWWQVLRKVLKKNGEMLMAADVTQDIYSSTKHWTRSAMTGAGFIGPWAELIESYRLPRELIPIAVSFAETFLNKKVSLKPLAPQDQKELFETCEIRWVQSDLDNNAEVCVEEMLNLIRNDSEESRSMVDCTVLVDSIKEGKKIMEILTSHEKQIKVTTTFVTNNRGKTYDDRRKKLAFWKGSPKIKISTLQSFKGWEGRMIIVNMTSFKTIKQKTLFYTGLTRLKKHINGSFMTVVSSDRTIEGFVKDLAKQKILPFYQPNYQRKSRDEQSDQTARDFLRELQEKLAR